MFIACKTMFVKNIRLFLGGILVFLAMEKSLGQEFYPSQRRLDKTRIQYQRFDWKYLTNANFEVYYYGKNESLARRTMQLLDLSLPKITSLIGYVPFNKAKVFVYPSEEALFQSNTGISLSNEADVLDENLSKFRIEIAFQHDYDEYRRDLVRALSRVYLQDMLFGGSLKESLQSSLFLNISDWFLKGLIAYLADGDSPGMQQFMLQSVEENKIKKLTLAKGQEAEWLGQSIWSYIVKMYGTQPVGTILNLTRIIRNEQTSISNTLKKPFTKILQDWYRFHLNQLNVAKQTNTRPNALKTYAKTDLSKGERLIDFELSPDGKWLVYSQEASSKIKVKLVNLGTDKEVLVQQYVVNDPFRQDHVKGPLMSFGKGNALHLIYTNAGKTWLQQYQALNNPKSDLKLNNKKELSDINCLSFSVSPNGQRLLMRVLRNGQEQVGYYDLRRSRFTAIEAGEGNDVAALSLGNAGAMAWVRAFESDSLLTEEARMETRSMYFLDPEQSETSKRLFRLRAPVQSLTALGDTAFLFLSPGSFGNGIIYKSLDSSLNFKELALDLRTSGKLQLTGDKVFVKSNHLLEQSIQTHALSELLASNRLEWSPNINVNTVLDSTGQRPNAEAESSSLSRRILERRARLERQFAAKSPKELSRTMGPFPYENFLTVNKSKGNFQVDPIRGLGYALQMNMNDLTENHLFKIGTFAMANLRSLDLFGEYAYLAKKMDWFVNYDRKVLNQESETNSQKIRYNRLEVRAVHPYDMFNKLAVSATFTSNRAIDQYNLTTPEDLSTFVGLKAEYIHDNTQQVQSNLLVGTRYWLTAEHQAALQFNAFTRLKVDIRKYWSISPWLYFNTRFSGSHIFGKNAPQTIMGGMDQWIFIQRESRTRQNPLGTDGIAQREVFMSDVAAPLRGFPINKLSGNSHLLLNAEFHVPVKYLLGQENPNSQLLNFLQIVFFGDLGTAWTGPSPFERVNDFNTNIYGGKNNPFLASVTDFRNPFLGGVGLGLRTQVLGTYLKFDYAYGIENNTIKTPISYLTLGYDF